MRKKEQVIKKSYVSRKKTSFAKKLEGLGFIDLVSLEDREIEKLRKRMR